MWRLTRLLGECSIYNADDAIYNLQVRHHNKSGIVVWNAPTIDNSVHDICYYRLKIVQRRGFVKVRILLLPQKVEIIRIKCICFNVPTQAVYIFSWHVQNYNRLFQVCFAFIFVCVGFMALCKKSFKKNYRDGDKSFVYYGNWRKLYTAMFFSVFSHV